MDRNFDGCVCLCPVDPVIKCSLDISRKGVEITLDVMDTKQGLDVLLHGILTRNRIIAEVTC